MSGGIGPHIHLATAFGVGSVSRASSFAVIGPGEFIALGDGYPVASPPMTAEQIAEQKEAARQALAQAQAQAAFLTLPSRAPNWLKADPKQPDTLGWREWVWDDRVGCLRSPVQGTLWQSASLVTEGWNRDDVVRGVAGIHAMLVPRHWKILDEFNAFPLNGGGGSERTVTGIVERFGKYVLGTEGWRAEKVIIRELLAPSTEIGLKLEEKYPDVVVHYSDQLEEGDVPCKSEKSSGLEKGSRSLLPSPSLLSGIVRLQPQSQSASQSSSTPSASGSPSPHRAWMYLALAWAGLSFAWAVSAAVRMFT